MPPPDTKTHILVVAGEPEFAIKLQSQVESLGYASVRHATDGEAAIAIAWQFRPDLVLIDRSLAGAVDSFTTVQTVRTQFSLPALFLTEEHDDDAVTRASFSEPFGYLQKPFSTRELRCAIEMALFKHRTDLKLFESKNRLRLARLGSMDGMWDADLVSRRTYYSARWFEMLGYRVHELPSTPDVWRSLVHPDDSTRIAAHLINTYKSDATESEVEVRLRHKDGHYAPVRVHATLVRNEQGKAIRVVGTTTDLTASKQMQADLQTQRDFSTQIVNTMGQGLCVTNAAGLLIFVNPAYARLFGYTVEEMIGKTSADLFPAEELANQSEQRAARLAGKTSTYESRVRLADGSIVPVSITSAPLWQDGHSYGAIAVVSDLTESKRAQEALRVSDLALRAISQGVIITGPDQRIQSVNEAFSLITGYDKKEVLGRTCKFLQGPLTDPVAIADMESALKSETEYANELLNYRKDGSIIWVDMTIAPVRDERGTLTNFIGITRDISERKSLEFEREIERRVLELVAAGGALPALLSEVIRCYESLFLGMRGSVLLLDQTEKRLRQCAAPNLPAAYCEALDGIEVGVGIGSCGTSAFTGKPVIATDIDSDPLWAPFKHVALPHGLRACWSVPILGSTGSVLGTFAFYFDGVRTPRPWELATIERGAQLTSLAIERQRAENTLQENEARYRSLFHWTPEPFLVHRNLRVINVNPAAVKMLGATSAPKLIGRLLFDLIHEDFHELVLARTKAITETGADSPIAEMKFLKADGTVLDVEVRGTMIVYDGAPAIHVALRNVTERKLAEVALRESEQRYRTLVEWSPEPVVAHCEGRIVYVNPAAIKMFGATAAEELFGRVVNDFVHPESLDVVNARLARLALGSASMPLTTIRIFRLDGSSLIVELQSAAIMYDGKPAVHVAFRDITERLQAEAASASLESQLRESQKMEAIGTL
ncbi:MAG: PAS domain S-box protein, partial [Usitatibacteraceae bacterium]